MAPATHCRRPLPRVALGLLALALLTLACGQPAAAPANPSSPAGGSQPSSAAPPASSPPPLAGEGATRDTTSVAGGRGPAQPIRLRLAYSELTPGQTITWTTQDAGIFRKHGLDVDLQYIASAQTLAAVMAGEMDVAIGGGYAPIHARLAGSNVSTFLVVSNFYPYLLMVTPDVNTPADLRGKVLGVSRFGSASDVATRVALRLLGLDPERDVTFVQVGSIQERFAAMRSGAIAGGLVSSPQTVLMRREGFKTLYDLSSSGEEELLNSAYATDTWLRANEVAAQAFVNAMLEGIWYAKQNPAHAKAVIQQYLKVDDPEALDDAYMTYVDKNQPRVPNTGLVPARRYLQELAATDPRAVGARAEDFFDLRFLERAQTSGFVDRLWAGQ